MAETAAESRTDDHRADIANRGGATLDECAEALGLSRERIRQIEARALRRCREWCALRGIPPEMLLDLARQWSE